MENAFYLNMMVVKIVDFPESQEGSELTLYIVSLFLMENRKASTNT